MIQVRILLPESSLKHKRKKRTRSPETDSANPFAIFEGMFASKDLKLPFEEYEPLKPEDYVSEHVWTFKDKNPFIYKSKGSTAWEDLVNATTVVTVADGSELELIRTHFQNIPWVINRRGICEWAGEYAKFIALNFDFKV